MTNLSSLEKKVFNYSTQEINPAILLGDKIQEIINASIAAGTPVNAVAATGTLDLTGGVVTHGESFRIDNPAVAGFDYYEFMADAAQSPLIPTHIPVDIESYTTKSSGTLTMAAQPTSGDKVTIGSTVYTFVPVGTDTAAGEISIGADLAAAKLAFVAAVNGTDVFNDPHPLVSASAFNGDDCTITALAGGVAGDDIDTTETFASASNLFAAAKLGSGADCTAANAITALVLAVTASDTQGVSCVDGAGDTVVFTAKTAGVAGNAITTQTAMVTGAFDDPTLTLGANGTVSDGVKAMVDSSYLYISIAANSISGTNWRRISLGSKY